MALRLTVDFVFLGGIFEFSGGLTAALHLNSSLNYLQRCPLYTLNHCCNSGK